MSGATDTAHGMAGRLADLRMALHRRLCESVEAHLEARVLALHLAERTARPALVLLASAAGWRLAALEGVHGLSEGACVGLDAETWLDERATDGWIARDLRHGSHVVGKLALLDGDPRYCDEVNLAAVVGAPFIAALSRPPTARGHDPFLRVAEVAQELRDQLAAMEMGVDRIERGFDLGAEIGRSRRWVRQASGLVDALVAAFAPGRLRTVELALAPMVANIVEDHRERAGRASLAIELTVNSTPMVSGHAPSIERAITDLIANALEAAPRGGVVRLVLDAAAGAARIRVCEPGRGAGTRLRQPVDLRAFPARAVFDLRLSSARRIVEAHGGAVMPVEGVIGSVELRLPLASASS